MKRRLEGKVAVITGGAKGLGQAIALTYANEGAKVIAADMGELTYQHDNVEGYILNVTDVNAVQKFYDDVIAKYGKVDILVNNAGITADAMTRKMTDEQWDRVINVNLKGVFNLTRLFGPLMETNGYGSIINISSVVGVFGNIGQANYAATKAGVIGFTKSLAREMASRGITVNAVAPGFIATDMTAAMPEKAQAQVVGSIPLGKMGQPEDIANAVVFLASDKASYITGQVVNVDGGMVM